MNHKPNKAVFADTTMTLGEHIEELRARLILAVLGLGVAVVVCMFLGKFIITFVEIPYVKAMGKDARLQCIDPAEGFISYMEISLIAGVVVASPWIFYHLWRFVGAGLYPHERRYVYFAVPFSAGLFIAGALFFIFVIAPVTLQFFVLFNKKFLRVSSNFTFANYISFVSTLMLVFGLAFQSPIAIFVLNRTGLTSIAALRNSRKYVFLGTVIVAASVIPGSDAFSLFALAIPVYLLYELGILLCRFVPRRRQNEQL